MGAVSPRSVKRLVNMHRLVKAIVYKDIKEASDLEDLVLWVVLAWRYPSQRNRWLEVRPSCCLHAQCASISCCHTWHLPVTNAVPCAFIGRACNLP